MKHYAVVITPFAGENILEAFRWYQLENPVYAAKWKSGLEEKILSLEIFPESHPLAPENSEFEEEIRQLLYGKASPWRVLFTVLNSKVYVLHVRHGQRDYWRPGARQF
ncbi:MULTISPECIES: type II toxin-antitoxin system RelE/ParE family toxin [unclassified Marinobacterium]|uniref:type II toxin-antitoxin system RelE/ParE family toxin n=1 Tax=unclassified Marinobacterium TaxID=2644139 RepID=UPI001569C7E2|nr:MULTISPECIES: type II toxin-antitoxin system RelE/ParE family toxin [unclassified Marinobacterium]NRP53621.1 Plasmid stabilization system protein [Marinobacterium sp. xm-v-242]NRP77871.1 Plasmid stabilization system protein [Marinobacterium sp. xm-m-383]